MRVQNFQNDDHLKKQKQRKRSNKRFSKHEKQINFIFFGFKFLFQLLERSLAFHIMNKFIKTARFF